MQLDRWQCLRRYELDEATYWKELRDAAFGDPKRLDTLASPPEGERRAATRWQTRPGQNRTDAEFAGRVGDAWLKGFLDPTLEDGIPISPPMSVITSSGRKPLPDSFSPSKFYHNYGRRLLIIGGPGGGKTIQLFKVADDLMPRGSAVDKRPIPIVLIASSWVDKPGEAPEQQQSIREWVDREFLVQYGFAKSLSAHLIKGSQRLIYCIDGYDE